MSDPIQKLYSDWLWESEKTEHGRPMSHAEMADTRAFGRFVWAAALADAEARVRQEMKQDQSRDYRPDELCSQCGVVRPCHAHESVEHYNWLKRKEAWEAAHPSPEVSALSARLAAVERERDEALRQINCVSMQQFIEYKHHAKVRIAAVEQERDAALRKLQEPSAQWRAALGDPQ